MSQLKIGHVAKNDESKIRQIPVTEGQVIYSENSGMQIVDYAGKRHVHGSVISGVYNDSEYVDFAGVDAESVLQAIVTNGLIHDGQLVKVGESVCKYRKISDKNLIVKLDESALTVEESKVGFVMYLPEFVSGDLVDMDILITISNDTNGTKLFLVKVEDNTLNLDSCQDLDGTFDSSTFDISVEHNGAGLFTISAAIESVIRVISYSVSSSSGSSKNEGLYVVASDL